MCRRLLSTFRKLCGSAWGLAQSSVLSLYKGLLLSRLLYALLLLSLAAPQRKALQAFHRVALCVYLGVPRYAGNTAVLVDAQEPSLQHQVKVRALRHIGRNFQMGFFATKFAADIGPPYFSPPLVSDSSRTPLDVHSRIPYPGRKVSTPTIVVERLVDQHLTTAFPDHL